MDILNRLHINEYAVIRMAFETLYLFPEDEPLCAELRLMLDDARHCWTHRLREALDYLQSDPDAINKTKYLIHVRFDYTVFQQRGLDIMRNGFPVSYIKKGISPLPLSFDTEERTLFYFPIARIRDIEELRTLNASSFFLLLLEEVYECVSNPIHYASKQQFDRDVFQEWIAFEYLLYEATIIAQSCYR